MTTRARLADALIDLDLAKLSDEQKAALVPTMPETRLRHPHYDFAQNFLRPLIGRQRERLAELVADPAFDPDDYHKHNGTDPHGGWCKVCDCRYSPGRVCGYCRSRVRALRAATSPVPKEAVA